MDDDFAREIGLLHATVCRALADPLRILIVFALARRPLSACDLAEELESPRSAVSRHLRILCSTGVVRVEGCGRDEEYHLADDRVIEALDIMTTLRLGEQRAPAHLVVGDEPFAWDQP